MGTPLIVLSSFECPVLLSGSGLHSGTNQYGTCANIYGDFKMLFVSFYDEVLEFSRD